ncbi:MAG: CusA/CzcA family heavy metal efflux RND transporter [Spirochaetes bacterium]|nr:CusA/CzcA family heavy metal efflux RND transporter [Spirochaetota bacterium]
MISEWIAKALRGRLWVILLTIAVIISGVYSISKLSIDAVPDITNVSVMVNTKTGALAPEEVEKTVTFPIESELAGLPDVQDIRSLSKYGLSQVIVVFSDSTDIYFARQLVNERIQSIRDKLPEGLSPELGPVSTGLGEIFMYAVTAKEGSALSTLPEKEQLTYLRTVQDYIIKPALKSVPGVAEVESNGGYKKEIHINVDPVRMEQHGIICHQLVNALQNIGQNYGGGYIQVEGKQIIVRTFGTITGLEQIKNIPVKLNVYGAPVRLRQVADVVVGSQQRLGAATLNGKETVLGTVLMRINANSREVALAVEKFIKEIPLPPDVAIKELYTRSFLVNATIKTVARNLTEGGLLVIAILFLILGNFTAAFLVALAIPLSMLVAGGGMLASGIAASLMSLGAIDFGLIVDGSVVMIENIVRHLNELKNTTITKKEKIKIIEEAAKEVSQPVFLGILIIMVVYVPVLSLTGIEGKMFRPMAETVLYALGGSILIAMFVMPVLAYYFISPGKKEKEPLFFRMLSKVYTPFLTYSLRHPFKTTLPPLLIAVVSIIMFFNLGSDFIPRLDEGDMVIGLVRDQTIGLDASLEIQKKSDRAIAQFKEVRTVFSRMGTPESATDPMGVNFADTFVILEKDKTKWGIYNGKQPNKLELFEAIAQKIEEQVPGQEISLTQPIEMRFNEILEGNRADITLRIIGQDLDKLYELSNKSIPVLESIKGASTVELDPLTALKKSEIIDVVLNYDKISRYGVNVNDVNSAFSIAMSGMQVGYLYDADKRFPIVVRISDRYRNNIANIAKIPVGLPDGGTIPIGTIASVEPKQQITTIARTRGQRYAAVSINLKNRDTQSFVNEAKEKVKALNIPSGYILHWGGQFKNLESARFRLLIIIPVVLAIIFIILIRTFKSITQTLLVFNSIPFALTGGIIFIYVRGIPLSVSAGIGFIALIGIAILNGMVLVNFFNQLRAQGMKLEKAVYEGTLIRLKPVLMTALVASLGFVPMAFNTGIGAEVQRPLATVVIGGLVSSTILTLLLLPALYLWVEKLFGQE